MSEMVRSVRRAARQRKFRRRRIAVFSVLGVLLVILAIGGWYELQANPLGKPNGTVVINVSRGENSASVVSDLVGKGVVSSSMAYHFYLFFHQLPQVQPGGYSLQHNMSFGQVDRSLSGGPTVTQLAVPAGLTLRELSDRVGQLPGLDAKRFRAAVQGGKVHSPWQPAGSASLEGLVAPGTYAVLPGESEQHLLQQMVDRFNTQAAKVGATPKQAAKLGLTPSQLITVASIVQKEGYIQSNMPKVARVIYNRLAQGMPLQMDSTVLYSLGRDGGPVTQQDEQVDTPYNTYLHPGLPPTPVSFPSTAALQAAAHPPAGSWLYFVVMDKHGDEAFASTFQQQQANEATANNRGLGS